MITLDLDRATPEFRNLFKYASALIAYTTITQVYYQGAIAGSEFLTYNAGKLYICLRLSVGYTGVNNSHGWVNLYDEGNAIDCYFLNVAPFWDTTAAIVKHYNNLILLNNVYFSRIDVAVYTSMIFNGYRLNV